MKDEKASKTIKARIEFYNRGLSYSKIGSLEIGTLSKILKEELSKFNNNGFRMTLRKLRKNDIEYKEDGSLKKCFFMVDGCVDGEKPYFKRREAISFNEQKRHRYGFICFAGSSYSHNKEPFIKTFEKFMDSSI